MRILHSLFTSGNGGLENSFIDVNEVLLSNGYYVSALIRPDAPYREKAKNTASELFFAQPKGFYDVLTAFKIRRLIKVIRPDLILAHNARAISLMKMATFGMGIKVCGVSHSYKTPRTMRADYLIVLTEHMRQHFINAGYNAKCLHVIPNMIRLPESRPQRPREKIISIGALGRFSLEKGFLHLLRAMHIINQSGANFKLRIGGEGEELGALRLIAEKFDLSGCIEWLGWVHDKDAFYRSIDFICVPSLEESFGLVVLEALAYGVPVIATDTPGPVSILTNETNGLIVPRGDIQAMVNAIMQLIENPGKCSRFVWAGLERSKDFSFETVSKLWDATLKKITSKAG